MSKHDKKDWNKFKEEHKIHDEDLGEEVPDEEVRDEEAHSEPALSHPSYLALEEQLTLAEQKAHEHWEKSVRALAELDNVRRRMEREVANAHKYGMEKLISALLPVVDSLEQALQLADKNTDAAMHEGLELTMKLFVDVLQKFDVTPLDPMGEPFDPQKHEAMSIQEVPGTPANSVIAVVQKGYQLNERVIRPARVIVSKKSSAE
ncbi:nucleotide exchange factor GrpE [Legionella bononiensis]|uniref:Protein GrpE n=1 Tax=Legionella bononiensis TaxID=2793102 RepID=A0ABS1WE48_9GAMM|nr:nucleotide exchange factor GrpE [Legionella bononiensis]MBL7479485.1 nucleotide exchange factor GrpE [Legionella bononiensis]MBL7527641.1 nucleotide exchange factor GrpE [Legionella bononiensis]